MYNSGIMRTDDLKEQNRLRILQALRFHGALTRVEIGKLTGLSQAALSTQFGLMVDYGFVSSETSDVVGQKRGRPKTTVSLDPNAAVIATVALTIDLVTFKLVDYTGTVLQHKDIAIDLHTLSTEKLFELVIDGIRSISQPYPKDKLKTISVGFQGSTDVSKGELIWSIILSERNVAIGAKLQDTFDIPVSVNNDCALIAKALHHQHREKVSDNFAAVLFSHGIGLGVYLGGKPFAGAHSSGFELGHIQYEPNGRPCRCGRIGCIEAYASNYGILRTAKNLDATGNTNVLVSEEEIESIIEDALNGEPNAIKAFELAGKAIGFGLGTVFTLLDPMPLALVMRNTKMLDLLREEIQSALTSARQGSEQYVQEYFSFEDDVALMHYGLALEGMTAVDIAFSKWSSEAVSNAS